MKKTPTPPRSLSALRFLPLLPRLPRPCVAALALAACSSSPPTAVFEGSGGSTGDTSSDAHTGGSSSGSGGTIQVITGTSSAQATCGNGVLDGTEPCDDGNTTSGDGCNKICQIEADWVCSSPGKACEYLGTCGNGVVTSNKACDDGNTTSGDGCSSDCQIEAGYTCRVPGKRCTVLCGDGIVSGSEECDDNNTKSGDGCSAACKIEKGFACAGSPSACKGTVCGNGTVETGEGCDDGNLVPFDGCSEDCQIEPDCSTTSGCTSPCGDGILIGDKECDDGNRKDGDGCSSDCRLEAGWTCQQPALGQEMLVPVLYRDFKFQNPTDFEPGVNGPTRESTGIVESALDGEGKPVFTGLTGEGIHIESKDTFAEWYRTTSGVNHATASKLALWKTSSGAYVNRYGANGEQWKSGVDGNPLFFPVDSDPFSASELTGAQIPAFYDPSVPWDVDSKGEKRLHNFSFTSEVRYWFTYDSSKTYQLDFVGDDDVWVFINRTLAVDLGGLHPPASGSVKLDAATAAKLAGLKSGSVYEVVVFQAERQTTASSYKLTLTGFNASATTCTSTCGDGVVVADEECDNGKDNSDTAYGGCTTSCQWGPFCGDGIVNGGEECDDGKGNGTGYGSSGCTFACTRAHFCGDGHVDTDRGEECDLGAKNGVALDRNGNTSTASDARVYCMPDCSIPPGAVY